MCDDFHVKSATKREERCMSRLTKAQSSFVFWDSQEDLFFNSMCMSDSSNYFAPAAVGQPVVAKKVTVEAGMTVGTPVTPVLDPLTRMWQVLDLLNETLVDSLTVATAAKDSTVKPKPISPAVQKQDSFESPNSLLSFTRGKDMSVLFA